MRISIKLRACLLCHTGTRVLPRVYYEHIRQIIDALAFVCTQNRTPGLRPVTASGTLALGGYLISIYKVRTHTHTDAEVGRRWKRAQAAAASRKSSEHTLCARQNARINIRVYHIPVNMPFATPRSKLSRFVFAHNKIVHTRTISLDVANPVDCVCPRDWLGAHVDRVCGWYFANRICTQTHNLPPSRS